MATVTKPRSRARFGYARRESGKFLMYVGLLVIGFIYLYPFLWMIGSSLRAFRPSRMLTRNG